MLNQQSDQKRELPYFHELLIDRGYKPDEVCVMRHTQKSPKNFHQVLYRWAHDEPSVFNNYQRGHGGPAGSTLAKAKYLASFIGYKPRRAKFVGLYRHTRTPRLMSPASYRSLPENQDLERRGVVFTDRKTDHRWFYLGELKDFEDLKFKLVIDWPGRPNGWCRWAGPDHNKFRILEGSDLISNATSNGLPPPPGELNILGQLDDRRRVVTRKEQAFLRKHLFQGRDHGTCFVCGQELPVELLVTAHIKRRADCSDEERRDLRNIVAMCLLGCDALFERGYLAVVDGKLDVRPHLAANCSGLSAILGRLRGRQISVEAERRKYFDYHAKREPI
jgi:hypothetical protein